MNREELRMLLKNLEVVRAYVDGKPIEVNYKDAHFSLWSTYTGDAANFINPYWEWRVKPTPREFWLVMKYDRVDVLSKFPPDYAVGHEVIHVREVTP